MTTVDVECFWYFLEFLCHIPKFLIFLQIAILVCQHKPEIEILFRHVHDKAYMCLNNNIFDEPADNPLNHDLGVIVKLVPAFGVTSAFQSYK